MINQDVLDAARHDWIEQPGGMVRGLMRNLIMHPGKNDLEIQFTDLKNLKDKVIPLLRAFFTENLEVNDEVRLDRWIESAMSDGQLIVCREVSPHEDVGVSSYTNERHLICIHEGDGYRLNHTRHDEERSALFKRGEIISFDESGTHSVSPVSGAVSEKGGMGELVIITIPNMLFFDALETDEDCDEPMCVTA